MMFRRGKWITKVHKCRPPSFDRVGQTSVWQCKCGEYWGNPPYKSIRRRLNELQREREASQDRTENGTPVKEVDTGKRI